MDAQISRFKRYVHETLGLAVNSVAWPGQNRLQYFLQDRYAFYEARILETPCILMIDSGLEEQSPATIRKHMATVQANAEREVIYVRDRVTAYNRKRLIEQKVAFVIPGNQLFLPTLGIDLREHFRKLRSESPRFSPSTQAVFIHWLLSGSAEAMTPSKMAERLGYSPMTMTRTFDELESAELGECITRGRERCVIFHEPKKVLWSKAQSFLRSPTKWRRHMRTPDARGLGVRAGLTALADYSMLAEPSWPVFAIGDKQWKELRQRRDIEIGSRQEPETCEIEIWSYNPCLFADNDRVDRFSLYLSLRDNRNERVEAALEEMFEVWQW